MNKKITLKTKPEKILEQFKDVLKNGGTINLDMGNGDFIYTIGGHGAILCKLHNCQHYSYQINKKEWVLL